ncbi:MAG: lipid-binding SYLF domain-containing protein [Pseudodesulfovibrio sp.]|nr:lipid-binding SYLF domain-containing protein [Pseudodesulfovibrio sp.]
MHMGKRHYLILAVIVTGFLFVGCAGKTTRGKTSDMAVAQAFVDEATQLLGQSLDKDERGTLKKLIARAKGIMIIPAIGDVSFLFSVGGGNAVMLANTDSGWTGPVFLSKGTAGFGLQAGVSKQSGFMLYMHEDDVRYLLKTGAVVKGQARLTLFTSDYKGNETPEFYESGDVYFVGEHSGLYAGIAIDGGGFSDRIGLNAIYSGVEGGGPVAILYEVGSMPTGAQRLRDMLKQAVIDEEKVSLSGMTKEKDGTEVPSN